MFIVFPCLHQSLPHLLHFEFYLPYLSSHPFCRFHQSSVRDSPRRFYTIRRIPKHRLHRLHQVSSSSSNREDSSNHRSISPSLDLFLYLNPSLFLCLSSLFLSIIRKLILYNILSSPRPSPYSLFYHPFYHPYSLKYYVYIHYFTKPYTYSIFYSSILYSLP